MLTGVDLHGDAARSRRKRVVHVYTIVVATEHDIVRRVCTILIFFALSLDFFRGEGVS